MNTPRFPLLILTRRRLNNLIIDANNEGYDVGYRTAQTIDDRLKAVPTRKKTKAKKDPQ